MNGDNSKVNPVTAYNNVEIVSLYARRELAVEMRRTR